MFKLGSFKEYREEDVPEEIVQMVCELNEKIIIALVPVIAEYDPNIILNSLNTIHAAFISKFSENKIEDKTKATLLCVKSLIRNVENMNNIRISETPE